MRKASPLEGRGPKRDLGSASTKAWSQNRARNDHPDEHGAEYHVPHALEELLEILAHIRRLGEFPGFELLCDCGIVWINPDQVVSICPAGQDGYC